MTAGWKASADPQSNLVGVGIGSKWTGGRRTRKVAIQLFVAHKFPRASLAMEHRLPTSCGGVATDVIGIGRIRAIAADPRSTCRPAFAGCSVGAIRGIDATVGTLGALVRFRDSSDRTFILSCNHVLSNWEQFALGTPIVQSAPTDNGHTRTDTIALLRVIAPLVGQGNRGTVDAALAEIISPALVQAGFGGLALGLSSPDPLEAFEGQKVWKVGRTTGPTSGVVLSVGASVTVISHDPDIGNLLLERQLIIRDDEAPFCDEGDSGALIVATQERRAVGLLCARAGGHSIANSVGTVLDELQITLVI